MTERTVAVVFDTVSGPMLEPPLRSPKRKGQHVEIERVRALRFAEFGPPSVLRIEEVAIPEPCEGEALVQVRAAAINSSDIADVAGRYKNTTLGGVTL